MKTYIFALFFIAAAFTLAECFPRAEPDEVVIVPLGRDTDSSEASSEESDEDYSYFRFGVPFFNTFESLFKSITERLRGVISAGPNPDWGKVTNATSTKKVVDGHVITINDTTYSKEGNDSDSVFFVRVIDIKPTELNSEEQSSSPSTSEVETLDSGKSESSNEISNGQTEERADLLERREYIPDASYDFDVDNSIDVFETKPISLEGDILVNKVRKDQTKGGIFMVPHDVEVFDVEDGKPVYSYNPYHPYQISQRTQKIVT